jgi:hypothetical protein
MGDVVFGEDFQSIDAALTSLSSITPTIDEYGGVGFPGIASSKLYDASATLFKALRFTIPPFAMGLYWWLMGFNRSFAQAKTLLHNTIQRRVKESQERVENLLSAGAIEESADCVLDMMIERMATDQSNFMSPEELNDELLSYIM